MSFLAPLFLAAIGAVSLPVLLHLIRRTPRGRVLFSSLMFLSPSPPRVTKRSRLEHWLLLAMRALAIVLIALAFARPFLWDHAVADAESTGPGRRIAILIDVSASMRREDLWKQAVAAAQKAAAEAKPTDSVALLAFDRKVNRVVGFDQWSVAPVDLRAALVTDAVAKLQPGHAATHLGDALIAAADLLSEDVSQSSERATGNAGSLAGREGSPSIARAFTGERHIVLISDLQSGSQLQSLGAYDWPAEVKVKLASVTAKSPTNAGLQVIANRESASPDQGAVLRLRVTNAAEAARERFTIEFAPAPVTSGETAATPSPLNIYAPPGESRTVVTGDLSRWLASGGSAVKLAGDDHAFDNTAYFCSAQPAEAVVVFISGDDAKDTQGLRYYLERAFPPSDRVVTRIVALKPEDSLPPGETDGASLFILADAIPAARAQTLRKRAESGSTVLVVARSAAISGAINEVLDTSDIDIAEATGIKDYAILSEIDFKHPLFAPFADPRFGDFTKIRFWKHRSLALHGKEMRVLAKFDNGSPALVEAPVGKGRCLILTAGWHPADGQLALSSKFVPLMNVLLQQSLGRPPAAARYTVGDAIDLAWLSQSPAFAGKTVAVKIPTGQTLALDEQHRVTQTDQPGVYTVEVGDTTLPVAVNLAASESDTAPLPAEELEKRGVKLWQSSIEDPQAAADRQRQMRMTELENRHKLWRWLLVAGLGVLMMETWLAGRFARAGATPAPSEGEGARVREGG